MAPRLGHILAAACLTASAPILPLRAETPGEAGRQLHDLFAREWEARLADDPLLATAVGEAAGLELLPDLSPAAIARRDRQDRAFLAELRALPEAELAAEDRVSARILTFQLTDRIRGRELGDLYFPFTSDEGFYIELGRLPQTMPLRSVDDFAAYEARLRALPRYFGQQIDWLRAGMERGSTQPRLVGTAVLAAVERYVVEDPEDSVFWSAYAARPAAVDATAWESLQSAGRMAIVEAALPAYAALRNFLRDEYLPASRESLGARELPDGATYYRLLIERYTSLPLSPQEVHDLGLREVAALEKEMTAVQQRVGFTGDFADFLAFLRTDSRFYAASADELLMRAAWIAKRMDGKLPALFRTLPRRPYTVEPVPPEIAPRYTAGRYVPPPEKSDRPGIYWVNTHDLPSRSLYNLEALTFHEAVPGHHLQHAIAEELTGLPPFRRAWYLSAFGEGWGLYSEWLGKEAGFYQDPYSEFGRLTYAMWRACRLVIDTGIHHFGWSRARAIDYLASHTALSLHEVETEIDRYISWPGQALSYKLGELTIRRLRQEAEEALGSAFDVRDFHDAVLRHGAVTLPVLEEQVRAYIEAARPTAAGPDTKKPDGT